MKIRSFFLLFLFSPWGVLATPRVAVLIVVDQLRADVFNAYASRSTGPLGRLYKDGARYEFASLDYVPTDTAPGHATLATGAFPKDHGIVGNRWWDAEKRKVSYVTDQSDGQVGPGRMERATLSEKLKAQIPGSQVASFSLKDRSAILMAGQNADATVWFDKKKAQFVSLENQDKTRAWLESHRKIQFPVGETGLSPREADGFLASPQSDRALANLASAFIQSDQIKLDAPLFLAVSFSGLDYVGHSFGPFSEEAQAQLRALDESLSILIASLDDRFQDTGYLLALSSDHGALPVPESATGRKMGAQRVTEKNFLETLEKKISALFPRAKAEWITSVQMPHIYLNRALAEALKLDWDFFLRRLRTELTFLPEIEKIYIPGQFEEDALDPYGVKFKNGAHPGRSGDLMIRLKEGLLVKKYYVQTGHGSPYTYDSQVPLVFLGPQVIPGPRSFAVSTVDVAPTLADWLEIDLGALPGKNLTPSLNDFSKK